MKNKFDFHWWANFAKFLQTIQNLAICVLPFRCLRYIISFLEKMLITLRRSKLFELYVPTDSTDRVLSHALRWSICWIITHQNHCISARIPSDGTFPLLACETSSGNCSIYKSTRGRVHSNGLYRRWRLIWDGGSWFRRTKSAVELRSNVWRQSWNNNCSCRKAQVAGWENDAPNLRGVRRGLCPTRASRT